MTANLRQEILERIRELANANSGQPPGRRAFELATGISEARWSGVYWARWSDAVAEAGLQPNRMQTRVHTPDTVIKSVAELAQRLGRVPTRAEIRLAHRTLADFPVHSVVSAHFPTNESLIAALRTLGEATDYSWLENLLPAGTVRTIEKSRTAGRTAEHDGIVYLLRSGDHYKIGRSDNLERRIREIGISLPETVTLVHAIRTDDTVGIESYWHRRFAHLRANGEWFKLTTAEVRAFRRRKFQ